MRGVGDFSILCGESADWDRCVSSSSGIKRGDCAGGALGWLHPQRGCQPLGEVSFLGGGGLQADVVGGVGGAPNDLVKGLQLWFLLEAVSFRLPGKLQHRQVGGQLVGAVYQRCRASWCLPINSLLIRSSLRRRRDHLLIRSGSLVIKS